MKALFRNFLAKAESALDTYWQHLTVGQSTYIGIKSQVPHKPLSADIPPTGAADKLKTPPDNATELCT
jgi:hypothetical protein